MAQRDLSPILGIVAQKRQTLPYLVMRIFLDQALEGRFTSRSWQRIIRMTTTEVRAWPDLADVGDPTRFLEAMRSLEHHREDIGRELLLLYDPTARGESTGELGGWTKAFALTATYAIYGEFERLGFSEGMDLIERLLEYDLSGHSVEQYGIRKALCVLRFLEIYAPDRRAECILTLWDARRHLINVQLQRLCGTLVSMRANDPVEQLNSIPLEIHLGRLARLVDR